jgi:hypothetical protein
MKMTRIHTKLTCITILDFSQHPKLILLKNYCLEHKKQTDKKWLKIVNVNCFGIKIMNDLHESCKI